LIASQLGQPKPHACLARRQAAPEPAYDPDELLGVIPADPRMPFDVREIIARLVDGSRFLEFKPEYGATLVCGHARCSTAGRWAFWATTASCFSESANKAAQFIQLCNQTRTPLIYLQNITGFMVGAQYERGGIIKHGSKMLNAVATSPCRSSRSSSAGLWRGQLRHVRPGATTRASCGPGPTAAWPSWAASRRRGCWALCKKAAAKRRGIEPDRTTIEAMQMMTRQKFEQESSTRTTRRRGCGTTAFWTRATRARR
jgi:hypothetical protein